MSKLKAHITDLSFYQEFLKEKKMVAESTVRTYSDAISMFLKRDPDLYNVDHYNQFIIDTSIKKRAYHYFFAIKRFIEFKIEDVGIKNKLIEGLLKPEFRQDIVMERRYLTEEDIIGVINTLKEEKHRVIALIQTLTGVRVGDVLRLKRDNIMPEIYREKPVLRINITGKGKKRNVIYIHDEIAQELIMNYITNNFGHNDYYFITLSPNRLRRDNKESEYRLLRMNYHWFWDDLKESLQKNLIRREDFASHDFRRCFARRAWEKWKDVHVLQSLLNHAQPAVTLRYLSQSGLKNIDYSAEMQGGTKNEEAKKQ